MDLFNKLLGQRVESIRQFRNERSFAIQFSNNFSLLFKMYGNRSNILLFGGEDVEGLFKNNIPGDSGLKLATLDRQIDWTFENFVHHRDNLQSIYFTFGKAVWKYLTELHFDKQNTEEQWRSVQELLQRLHNPIFYISEIDAHLTFTLLPMGTILKEFQDPLKAINDFFICRTQHDTFAREKASTLAVLKLKLQGNQNYYERTRQKLSTLQADNNYKIWADLLMANLHTIKAGSERVILPNFYKQNYPTEIKLKKDLSPQKNAEVLYGKSKQQQLEVNRLHQAVTSKEKEIAILNIQIQQVNAISDLKSLRNLTDSLGVRKPKEKQPESLPYHEFEYNSFKILVGKNAKCNDRLTQEFSHKEDLWLHAKDVAGSHVVIKHQSGKKFPKDVIERAAQLAAYHSRRKTESLCPVVVTPRKYIRKRKGDSAGSVIVERESIILVQPKR